MISRPECVVDSDCPSRLACMQETCRDPCPALSPCGRNAECSVQNTAPSRTMVCMCRPGYVGDANVACNLRKIFTWANTLYIYYFYLLALVETAVHFSLVIHSVARFAPCPASCFRKAGLAVYFFRMETFSQSKCVYSITSTLTVAYHVILQFCASLGLSKEKGKVFFLLRGLNLV